MTKYHVSSNGEPAVCKARSGNCPLSDESDHIVTNDINEAREFAEKKNAEAITGGGNFGTAQTENFEDAHEERINELVDQKTGGTRSSTQEEWGEAVDKVKQEVADKEAYEEDIRFLVNKVADEEKEIEQLKKETLPARKESIKEAQEHLDQVSAQSDDQEEIEMAEDDFYIAENDLFEDQAELRRTEEALERTKKEVEYHKDLYEKRFGSAEWQKKGAVDYDKEYNVDRKVKGIAAQERNRFAAHAPLQEGRDDELVSAYAMDIAAENSETSFEGDDYDEVVEAAHGAFDDQKAQGASDESALKASVTAAVQKTHEINENYADYYTEEEGISRKAYDAGVGSGLDSYNGYPNYESYKVSAEVLDNNENVYKKSLLTANAPFSTGRDLRKVVEAEAKKDPQVAEAIKDIDLDKVDWSGKIKDIREEMGWK